MNVEVFSSNFACGVRLKVSKQALFVFDFAQWEPGSAALAKGPLANWQERVFARMRCMNLFLACFYTSMLRMQKTTSPKLFIDYTTYVAARSFALDPWHVQCDLRQASVIREAEEWHRKFKPTCMTVPENILQTAVDMIDMAIAKDSRDVATLAELLLHAFYLYESGKYAASHTTAWAIAERCLRELWETHLAEKSITSKRKMKATASDISKGLYQSGRLPCDKYKLDKRVIGKRNDWLHSLEKIDRADAADAIVLAQFLLRETGVFDVEMPFHVIGTIPIAWVSE
jgi:hypothetical protein